MFEYWQGYDHILVTGPQRSGTRIAAHMIAEDTGFTCLEEAAFGVHDVDRLRLLLEEQSKVVIQCPAVCHAIETFAGCANLLVVLMVRPLDDIYASQKRVGWEKGIVELAKYGRTKESRSAEVKYAYWLSTQRALLPHWYELDYAKLSYHPLWVDAADRVNFTAAQWKLEG